MKITRLITTLIIFIILLSGCDSSGKDKRKDSAQTKEFRISTNYSSINNDT